MRVHYRRIDKSLPEPAHQTRGAVAFDLIAREDVEIPADEVRRVPTNLVVLVPDGYVLIVAARSSLPIKRDLLVANGIGLIDQDYCGPQDEIAVLLRNVRPQRGSVWVRRGERVAQAMLVPAPRIELVEDADLSEPNRGGFGATGGYET